MKTAKEVAKGILKEISEGWGPVKDVEYKKKDHHDRNHKAYDVYHKGEHLGHVHSYETTSYNEPGKVKASSGLKSRKFWAHVPKQGGEKHVRGEYQLASKDHAAEELVRAHGRNPEKDWIDKKEKD